MGVARVVTFGEIMLRLSPTLGRRLIDVNSFEAVFGGGEANVAVSLANFGLEAQLISRLPDNELGQACLRDLRKNNVGTEHVILGGDRIGIYFYEFGAAQRASKVVYDRANSAFATIRPEMIDWPSIFSGVGWFHFTGITPAISESASETCLAGVKAAKKRGIQVSCDLNYRSKLWNWGGKPSDVMGELLKYVDVVIGNEEDADKVFGISAPHTVVKSGIIDADHYHYVGEKLLERFPNLQKIALTLRGSHSADHNTWSGVLCDREEFFVGPSFEITPIVDRVGTGDAFAAGLIFGLNKYDDPQQSLDFAVCASCLKHGIYGDVNMVSRGEVENFMQGNQSGRVVR